MMLKRLYHVFFLITFIVFFPVVTQAENTVDYQTVVAQISGLGDDLINQYQPQDGLATMDGFSKLYFDHYEGSGMEMAVAAISPAVNSKTEALFTQIIGSASQGAAASLLKADWAALKIRLHADLDLLQTNRATNFFQAFVQSFSILLREGFEALIIVTALLTYLRRSQNGNKSAVIYYGVGLALVASVVTAVLFATLFKNLGANRELIEGGTMLFAAAVMFYVSYWLISKRESVKWQRFIQNTMNQALANSNMFALGLAAFLAVYREGAETILFYQALLINSKGQLPGIMIGFAAAFFSLLLIYWAIQKASFKIPYRLFFTVTALFLYYMAFSFIGGGILELQETGWVDITPIQHFPQITWLGIFPAWQNVGAQLVFLVPTVAFLLIGYIRQ